MKVESSQRRLAVANPTWSGRSLRGVWALPLLLMLLVFAASCHTDTLTFTPSDSSNPTDGDSAATDDDDDVPSDDDDDVTDDDDDDDDDVSPDDDDDVTDDDDDDPLPGCASDQCGMSDNGSWCGDCPASQYCQADDDDDDTRGGYCTPVLSPTCPESGQDNRAAYWRMNGAGPQNRNMVPLGHTYFQPAISLVNPNFYASFPNRYAGVWTAPWAGDIALRSLAEEGFFSMYSELDSYGLLHSYDGFADYDGVLGLAFYDQEEDGVLALLKYADTDLLPGFFQIRPTIASPEAWEISNQTVTHLNASRLAASTDPHQSYPVIVGSTAYVSIGGTLFHIPAHDPAATDPGILPLSVSVNPITAPSADCNENLYVGSVDRTLYSVTKEGHGRWTYETGGYLVHAPTIDHRQRVLFGSYDYRLYALSNDGNLEFSVDLGGRIIHPPAVDVMDHIYVVADTTLFKLSASGHTLWSISLPGSVTSPPTVNGLGWCFVTTEQGVLGFEPRDGEIVVANALDNELIEAPTEVNTQRLSQPVILPNGVVLVPIMDQGGVYWLEIRPDGF